MLEIGGGWLFKRKWTGVRKKEVAGCYKKEVAGC
jgi:hypothetical protein